MQKEVNSNAGGRTVCFSSIRSHGQCSTKFTWKQGPFLLSSGVAVVHWALVVC